jgi:hypothetical protein
MGRAAGCGAVSMKEAIVVGFNPTISQLKGGRVMRLILLKGHKREEARKKCEGTLVLRVENKKHSS